MSLMRMKFMAIGLALGVAMAAPAVAEQVTFQSGDYADFRQLLAGDTASSKINIVGTLTFPDKKRERSPAIVIVHTISGYQEANEGWHAAQFRESGFATLTYDSPAARRMAAAPAAVPSGGPPWASAVAEAYGALRVLANDPRIDPARIAIVGFSFGGEVAHLAAVERLATALAPDGVRFVAHVAYYPAGVYGAAAEQKAYTGAPILMLLGDKDDNLPVAKAQEYLDYVKAAGGAPPIEVKIYPGAYHAWTVSTLGAPRFYPQYASTRKCPYLLLGEAQPSRLVEGRPKPFDPIGVRSCLQEGRGYSMAYDAPLRVRSTEDATAFLLKSVGP
jgi:dienelactone hydrolase